MEIQKTFDVSDVLDEFRLWSQWVSPTLSLPANVFGICLYGFTEMLNNVIDHSGARHVGIQCQQDSNKTIMSIEDDGIGIFQKLCQHFPEILTSNIEALVDLVKGKLTVAPEAHSGEGIFFASKMFDQFTLESGGLRVVFEPDRCCVSHMAASQGTRIHMQIQNDSQRTLKEVFNRFADPQELTFAKTRFFISVASFEGDLVSRSQAKRVLSRMDVFREAELDFGSVEIIGQAFADELLRVWPLAHPQTRLIIKNAGPDVSRMLDRAGRREDLPQPRPPGMGPRGDGSA